MYRIYILLIRIVIVFILTAFCSYKVYADETELILKQLQILQEDIKTLEKAVYSKGINTTANVNLSSENSDV